MPPGGGGRASHGSAEAIHSRPTGAARPSHGEPDPIEPQRRSRSSTSPGRSRSRGVAPIARTGPTFDLSTPRAKPIANLRASLAGFGHDPLRERVRSGAAAARARGQGFGRRPHYRPPDRRAPEVIRPSEVDEQAAHEFLAELYSLLSAEAEVCIRHEEYTMEWPQLGERLRGRRTMREFQEANAG
jgi:hypothetical protein